MASINSNKCGTMLIMLFFCTCAFDSVMLSGCSRAAAFHAFSRTTHLKRTTQNERKFIGILSSSGKTTGSENVVDASIAGVSVSDRGFWMMLEVATENNSSSFLAIQVTNNPPEDTLSATSAESLTMLQLISSVDMAGPILPPEFLGQLTVLHCEEQDSKNEQENAFLGLVKDTLPTPLYSECNTWQRAKVRLPKTSLNQVLITVDNTTMDWTLSCGLVQFPQLDELKVKPTPEVLRQVCFSYDEQTSAAFSCLACALRYKAPISMDVIGDIDSQQGSSSFLWFDSDEDLQKRFPLYKSSTTLKTQSDRVHTNIERGFEIHKLSGALRIAMERGDEEAVRKIRLELDKYDSMDDLPTTPNDGLDKMQ